jgi:chromosomal replication initiator protein
MFIINDKKETPGRMKYDDKIWQTAKGCLKEMLGLSDMVFNVWFGESSLELTGDCDASVSVPTEFKRGIVTDRYLPQITQILRELTGIPNLNVTVTSREKPTQQGEMLDMPPTPVKASTFTVPKQTLRRDPPGPISPGYMQTPDRIARSRQIKSEQFNTFDNFIVGSSNKFAHAACIAVTNNPARDYNPLFIYGPSGIGKTHLLSAILYETGIKHPDMNVLYVRGEDFTNQIIEAIKRDTTQKFRDRYRTVDMLLIDDIQFIGGKTSTQEEFFHTFNALYEERKQIVLTSDKPPRDIKHLEERLRTRFEWGLIADIQPPDAELRAAILKYKAECLGVELPPDVVQYVADNLKNNIRQLEGAIKRIIAQSFLTGREITVDLAITSISDMISASEPVSVTVDRILECVSRHYGISIEDLKGRSRTRDIANTRHIAIYLIRNLTGMSLPAIGQIFKRDHTTILSSLDTVEKNMKRNPLLEIEIEELAKEIKE